jgi:hypothetical protein
LVPAAIVAEPELRVTPVVVAILSETVAPALSSAMLNSCTVVEVPVAEENR